MIDKLPARRRLQTQTAGTEDLAEMRRFDQPYHLTGDGYRVVLGSCHHTSFDNQKETGRPAPAKTATTIRKEEVKS